MSAGSPSQCIIYSGLLYAHSLDSLYLHCTQGVEKLIVSKLLVEGSNRRIYNVDRHAGMVSVAAGGGMAKPGACRKSHMCMTFVLRLH